MNCPSRVDPIPTEGWNQNPDALNADATTRADLDHMANARLQRDHRIDPADDATAEIEPRQSRNDEGDGTSKLKAFGGPGNIPAGSEKRNVSVPGSLSGPVGGGGASGVATDFRKSVGTLVMNLSRVLRKYAKFIGPGFMVAVAYIDPGKQSLGHLWPFYFLPPTQRHISEEFGRFRPLISGSRA